MRALLLFSMALATVLALVARPAAALERNFAGSAMADYHLAPANHSTRATAFDGFTTELALKAAIDVTERFSASVKVCYGCHGFELPMAHLDYRFGSAVSLRVGRFSPSLGAFNLRHDPANHRLSSKPLIYDMGRMLRMREWNLGVLPSPFPDNGAELSGTHWFGESVQLDWAAYAVAGFKSDAQRLDLDWQRSRTPDAYYVDNNHQPAVGARVVVTARLGETSDLTFGASAQHGSPDPDRKLRYTFFGGDLTLRVRRTNVRVEYLGRRQTFETSDPTQLAYRVAGGRGDFFVKQGLYAEIEQPLSGAVDLVLRYDFMSRNGNVQAGSPLTHRSAIHRGTVGFTYALERGLRLKASTESWHFTDADHRGRQQAVGFHLGLVGTF